METVLEKPRVDGAGLRRLFGLAAGIWGVTVAALFYLAVALRLLVGATHHEDDHGRGGRVDRPLTRRGSEARIRVAKLPA